MNPQAVAEKMMSAWQVQDWDAVTAMFAEDGVLEIVPARASYTGHAEIRGHLDEVAGGIESLTFEVKTLCAAGNVVTFERDDVFVYNGKPARVPCVGIMEIDGEYVQVWREYFDGMTMARAIGLA